MYGSKEEALEAAAQMALDGSLPTPEEVSAMLDVGVDYQQVHAILSEVFYDGKELEEW